MPDCPECHKSVLYLRDHVKRQHPDKVSENFKYPCDQCHRKFSDKKNFNAHKNREHGQPQQQSQTKTELICPKCSHKGANKEDMMKHFEEVHEISINVKKKKFSSFCEFESWKAETEKQSKSSFINAHGSLSTKKYVKITYVCNRSGIYTGKGKGLRHLKRQGSNKINGFCPAAITVTKFHNDKCSVVYLSTHIGHENDLGHLFLTKEQREILSNKIAAKIPFPVILDEIRDSVTNCNLERLHLLTKKDLFNIEQCYNLTSVRQKSDSISVESFVNEMKESGCILFYKPQDTTSHDYPQLLKDDFMLIIMNQGQKEMLQKFGHDCICLAGTHGSNTYDFELITLLILTDLGEGFPACFLFTNRTDEQAMCIFFNCIKNVNNQQIYPRVFMSDMADSFYNAWLQVMLPAEFRLYCSWDIDRAWLKNLNKIKSKETQAIIYKQLRTLLQETDKLAFVSMLQNFMTSLAEKADAVEFANYFQKYYGNNYPTWAYCYRIDSGLNTNMHLERIHRSIKYLYLHGKHNKRLDKAIMAILKFVRDKLFDQTIISHKEKLSTKLTDLRTRHSIMKSKPQMEQESLENGVNVEVPHNSESIEPSNIVKAVSKTTSKPNNLQEKMATWKRDLYETINSITTEDEFEAVKKIVAPLKPTLAAMRTGKGAIKDAKTRNHPHNKKIDFQRRLFTTKKSIKKNKQKKKISVDRDIVAIQLLSMAKS